MDINPLQGESGEKMMGDDKRTGFLISYLASVFSQKRNGILVGHCYCIPVGNEGTAAQDRPGEGKEGKHTHFD